MKAGFLPIYFRSGVGILGADMVDRFARDQAARLVASFRDGAISSDQFGDQFPRDSEDQALEQIYQMLWFSYDDLHEHKLDDKHPLDPRQREMFDRCVLFLDSNLEYTWPEHSIFSRLFWGLLITVICFVAFVVCCAEGLLSWIQAQLVFGGAWVASIYLMRRAAQRKHVNLDQADTDVWPFPHRGEYERAVRERLS